MEPKEIYIPLVAWDQHYKWPTLNGMRTRFKFREDNGFKDAFVRDGKRILVKANAFWKCIEQKNNVDPDRIVVMHEADAPETIEEFCKRLKDFAKKIEMDLEENKGKA